MSKKQRESFLFYLDWWKSLQDVEDTVRREVIEAVMTFVFEGETMQLSPLAHIAFSFIKPILERDQKKYENTCEKRRAAGKKHKGNQYKKTSEATTEEQDEAITEQVPAEDATTDTDATVTIDSQEDVTEYINLNMDAFIQLWNQAIKFRESRNLTCYMKPIDLQNIPEDAIARLTKIHKSIIRRCITSDEQVDKILLDCGVNINSITKEQRTKELAAKVYVARAMKNLAKITMKPKNTLFGTFQWFCNAQNVSKLYNGDIQ